jgi:hypothetical protein
MFPLARDLLIIELKCDGVKDFCKKPENKEALLPSQGVRECKKQRLSSSLT